MSVDCSDDGERRTAWRKGDDPLLILLCLPFLSLI